MTGEHHYKATIRWTGNKGHGTANYKAYDRDHVISIDGKPEIPGSSDPAFRGNKSRYNPEDLLVSSLSACHMLWYLLCAQRQASSSRIMLMTQQVSWLRLLMVEAILPRLHLIL